MKASIGPAHSLSAGRERSWASLFSLTPLFFATYSPAVFANDPDCTGIDRWPTASTFMKLKAAGLIKSSEVDHQRTKTVRLASEKISQNRYRQVHEITFFEKTGRRVDVIANSVVSSDECSESDVEVFVISKRLADK